MVSHHFGGTQKVKRAPALGAIPASPFFFSLQLYGGRKPDMRRLNAWPSVLDGTSTAPCKFPSNVRSWQIVAKFFDWQRSPKSLANDSESRNHWRAFGSCVAWVLLFSTRDALPVCANASARHCNNDLQIRSIHFLIHSFSDLRVSILTYWLWCWLLQFRWSDEFEMMKS